jgi:uncharacterized UBP type Zn finger protein
VTGETDSHLPTARRVEPLSGGCQECLQLGLTWIHLRICLTCGHVGCCDSSPGRHAAAHFHTTGHPIIESLEPDEDWGWCYVHGEFLDLPEELRVARG